MSGVSGRLSVQAGMHAGALGHRLLSLQRRRIPASKISKRPSRPAVLNAPVGRSLSCTLRLNVVGHAPQQA
jgi:hypothetical protein